MEGRGSKDIKLTYRAAWLQELMLACGKIKTTGRVKQTGRATGDSGYIAYRSACELLLREDVGAPFHL